MEIQIRKKYEEEEKIHYNSQVIGSAGLNARVSVLGLVGSKKTKKKVSFSLEGVYLYLIRSAYKGADGMSVILISS